MTAKKDKPTGREAVRAAVIEAASELFAARGVEAVSVRDIAAKANVNYGLIHRHFGTKENLLQDVLKTMLHKLHTAVGRASFDGQWLEDTFRTIQGHEQLWRLEAMIGLGGQYDGRVESGFPIMGDTVEAAQRAQAEGKLRADIDAKSLVAALGAMTMGLLVFGDMIMQGTGQQAKQRDQAISDVLAAIVKLIWN